MFVDYAGATVPVFDQMHLNAAALPAHMLRRRAPGTSDYTYAEATLVRGAWRWVSAHVNALAIRSAACRR